MAAEVSGVGNVEVPSWLKSMPVAPEYHPTLAEFQDPIAYIFKIEKEAAKYGICKIVPPVSAAPRKTVVSNFNKSLLARSADSGSGPTFTTRQQQIGFCPRKHRPVQKPVWQSGERYTLAQFEAKAKNFERNYLKKYPKKGPNALEMEALYWNAMADKPFRVEYANDMPGSAFVAQKAGGKRNESAMMVGETEWNMRGVSRDNLSLLRFMKEEIPGVTSPMVYVAMMFSWFAWHVEDHDLHSMNYLHMGAGKTWYGVPREAAVAFEEVVREHGYGGEVNPLVTFAMLGEKTTVMSPEVLLSAGVPCCRLVQNAGEFVVTFPRAYHSGFSHGFNCGEAANIATPEWLRVAREAAIRRAAINCPPMVSHFQLLYDLALVLHSRVPKNVAAEPRSSRLKDKRKGEGDMLVKELFIHDMSQNNHLLCTLGKGSPVVLLPEDSLSRSISSGKPAVNQLTAKSRLFPSLYGQDLHLKHSVNRTSGEEQKVGPETKKGDSQCEQGLFSCVTCGILCFACVAIVRPMDVAACYLMSADCTVLSNWEASDSDHVKEANATHRDLYSDEESPHVTALNREARKEPSSLGLLALAYGNSSDSEGDETDINQLETVHPTEVNPLIDSIRHQMKSQRDTSNLLTRKTDTMTMAEPKLLEGMSPDEDSSRLHVFCLEHAVQVEKRLSRVGGAHVFLFCHPDYPELESRAKKAAEESGTECTWNQTHFRAADEEDDEIIWLSLENENAIHGNRDWAVKLGINLFYSASLSRSPLYSKQMHYNSVIYKAFGRRSHTDTSQEVKGGRQKKVVVAGKWCGKVWMSNQAHPLLVNNDDDHDPGSGTDFERETGFWAGRANKIQDESPLLFSLASCHNKQVKRKRGSRRPKEESPVPEGPDESFSEKDSDSCEEIKSGRSRRKLPRSEAKKQAFGSLNRPGEGFSLGSSCKSKRGARKPPAKKDTATKNQKRSKKEHEDPPTDDDEDDEAEGGGPSTRLRTRPKPTPKASRLKASTKDSGPKPSKPKKSSINKSKVRYEEEEYECDMEGCTMRFGSKHELSLHQKNVCPVKGCGKTFFSHKYLIQHRRVHVDERPLKCPWKGCRMTFKWAWARTEHIRVHTGARPYICTVAGCGQTFRFVSDFSRHKRKTGHAPKRARGG
ncbi:Lysine-specific demethylase REF6 [Striga hermonthica]|uniref:Lysine-specific demethylase REF6 n=1 Tax=Striga hermonthica TaxID=68872 RepID=A0A9N7NY31_STRHE|nr:Lysine-specific demethylase REF6 [Striga hermonthica]